MDRAEILDKAKECVCGNREADYGSPERSFQAIADLWTAYLVNRTETFNGQPVIFAKDVAIMMVLFKMARLATGRFKADSWIDAAGYCACGGEIDSRNEDATR
jgi:hypothetical protein